MINSNIDIALSADIHSTSKSRMKIPRYNFCFTTRPNSTAYSGRAIIIRNYLKHYEFGSYHKEYFQKYPI